MNLSRLVRRAGRRFFRNALIAQGANVASVALGTFILVLLAGTDILRWQIAVFLPAAAVGAGLYLARKRTPSPYRAAQIVDQRMGLSDALSTALYFAEHESTPAPAEIRRLQSEHAERAAASVDVKKAVPYTMPRAAYAMAALALVASSLFALRFVVTRRLDLQPPIARILQQLLGIEERTEQARNQRRPPAPDSSAADDNGVPKPEDQQRDSEVQEAEHEDQTNRVDDLALPGNEKSSEDQKNQSQSNKADGEEGADPGQDQAGIGEESKPGEKGEGKAESKEDANGNQDANNSANDNSSLLSKMKDAMQNLLSKMKPQQQNQSGSQQAAGEQNNKQGKGQQPNRQQSAKNNQQGQQGEPQDGQAGEQGQDSQDQDGKGEGKNESSQKSKQPGSGQGSHDGDKSIRNAQQLEAMGKISEIIGKRAANVTGEATVEVQNTNQQIRTPYAQRGVSHAQGGAEINRDEVPVALQSYVQQYFEQVRKQQPPATPAPAKK